MRGLIVGLIYLSIVLVRFFSQAQAEGNLRQLAGKEVKLMGRISSESTLQGNSQRFKIGRVMVVTGQYPRYQYGDKVEVFGILQRRLINQWHSQFSLMYPKILEVKAERSKIIGLDWKEPVFKLRAQIEQVYNRNLPEPEASLLAGIVLGTKRSLDEDFWQALQRTGTLHIVVASGYNVTVVLGTIVGYLAGWIKRKWAVWLGIVAVVIYTVMAGAEVAIVRAAIMGSLAFLAQVLGRRSDGARLLLVAVLAMVVVNPLVVFDVGFQLSVMATMGLMFVSPLLGRWLDRVWLVGKDISETVGAQIAVWPIILINFSSLSVFSWLVNAMILWLVPIVMGLGAVLAIVGWVEPLGRVVGGLVYAPLTLMVRVIEWFGSQAWISWAAEGVSWWWGLGYYLVLILIGRKLSQRADE